MLAQEQNTTAINDYLIDKCDINRTLIYESEPKKYQI
jgi:glutathione S-transferase